MPSFELNGETNGWHHHHHYDHKVTEKLEKIGNGIKEILVENTTPPIGPGSIPAVTPASIVINGTRDLLSQATRIPDDVGVLISLLQTASNHGLVDDRKYLVERVVKLAASLPSGTAQNQLTGQFIGTLWNNLRHPPLSYLGDEFKYRMADGSNNNIMYPQLGKAGSPYARSVVPVTQLPAVLPDAGVIFDALFAREGAAKEHPNKISSFLFHQASIMIHDVFRTSETDSNRVNSSSYLDLSPLYGANQDEQNKVRTFQNGMLKPDAFAEIRLLGFPPGVAALLVCYNRFHNYVAGQLLEINEGDRFSLPPGMTAGSPGYDQALLKRDNDLFQTARLVTCGLYVNIILGDYVRTILNLNRSNSTWSLDPRGTFDDVFNMEGIPSGVGNQVSAEFNLIYRWHAGVSNKDEQWTKEFYDTIFPGQDPNALSKAEFFTGLGRWMGPIKKQDPGERTFGGLKRTQNGSGPFEDSDLIKILTESIEDVAGAFGARNVPTILKAVEILGIEQGRKWKVATLNEFRKFFKLQPYSTFKDINSDEDVAKSLETLYVHPDYVELYPGLVAEEAKRPEIPGSGLCPGYTVATAILSDAVSLVRGDRFYTVDYGSASLTNWGLNEVSYNAQIAGGGVMYKLLMRAFPSWFRGNSVYAMFPFTVPEETREILRSLGKEQDYSYEKPAFVPQPQAILTWEGVTRVLGDQATFKVTWGPHTKYLTGQDYMLSGDAPANAEQRKFVDNAVYCPKNHGQDEIRQFYEALTTKLVKKHSNKLRNTYTLDAVRDVGNTSHAQFIAHLFHIPIQSDSHPLALMTDEDLYTILSLLFAYVFLDFDSAKSFGLRAAAKQGTDALGKVMKDICTAVKLEKLSMTLDLFGMISPEKFLSSYGTHLISRLFKGGKSIDEVVWTIIPTAAAAVATQAQGFAQMLDLFLSEKYISHWPKIQELAASENPAAFELLKKYALEGYRLATPAFGLLRKAETDTIVKDGANTVNVKKGEQIFVDFVSAGMDPTVFPDPEAIKLDRPDSSYIHHGYGPHACLGRPIVVTAMAAQLRVFGRLKGLRRAPGLEGQLKSQTVNGAFKVYMREDWSDWWPYPTTMKVHFDGFEDETLQQQQNWEAPNGETVNGDVQNGEATNAEVQNGELQKEEPKKEQLQNGEAPKDEPLNGAPQIIEPPKDEATTEQPQKGEVELATGKAQIDVKPSGISNGIAPAGEHLNGETTKEEEEEAQVLTKIGWCRVGEVLSEEVPDGNGELQGAETSAV